MDFKQLHNNLLSVIKSRTCGMNMASVLTDILPIGKEAIYRRIRGEVLFTFNEVAAIAEKLGISLDEVLKYDDNKMTYFILSKNEYVNPLEQNYSNFEDSIKNFTLAAQDPESEMGSSCNILPHHISMCYDNIHKFRTFKWLYLHRKMDTATPFSKLEVPDQLFNLWKEHSRAVCSVKNTFYIWDSMIFSYLVSDIKYFQSVHLMNQEDIRKIKKELYELLENVEEMVVKGRCGENKVQIYLSNINLSTNYSYLQSANFSFALVWVFTLDAIASYNRLLMDDIKEYMQSLKRLSTLISETGEKQRVQFLNKQRKIIDTL